MDKSTLSNYGWIVIAVLVLSVMIALATPFGKYIEGGVRATTEGLFGTSQNAMNTAFEDFGVQVNDQEFIDMSKVNSILENNSWETIYKVAKSNKTMEAGWQIGDTKSLKINDKTYNAMIIGINHEGNIGIAFMIQDSIATDVMNNETKNKNGWEDSEMREWLNNTIYLQMNNKNYIKDIVVKTNNAEKNDTLITKTVDKIFLLSLNEIGITNNDIYKQEGTTYEWFAKGGSIDSIFWCRTPNKTSTTSFYCYSKGAGSSNLANNNYPVRPCFVIG